MEIPGNSDVRKPNLNLQKSISLATEILDISSDPIHAPSNNETENMFIAILKQLVSNLFKIWKPLLHDFKFQILVNATCESLEDDKPVNLAKYRNKEKYYKRFLRAKYENSTEIFRSFIHLIKNQYTKNEELKVMSFSNFLKIRNATSDSE